MPTAHGYTRVSSTSQSEAEGLAQHGMSMEAQEEAIKRYFEYRLKPQGWTLGEIFQDAGASAEKLNLDHRPEGARMAGLVARGDAILVARMDRGFRNPADLARMLELWDQQGISLHLIDINMDTSTALGKLMAHILSALAQWENNVKRDRMLAANERRRAQGLPVGATPPWGWKIIVKRDKTTGKILERRFAVHKEQRAWAQRIIHLKHHGFVDHRSRKLSHPSFYQITYHLIHQNAKLPGVPELSEATVRRWYHRERRLQTTEAQRAQAQAQVQPEMQVSMEPPSVEFPANGLATLPPETLQLPATNPV